MAATVGMAFRRLKIVDLSDKAAQPMRSRRSGTWLVFNGEIYNHAALRDELRALGHDFVSASDTEVVLAAWDEWGARCFERFDGMWAMVFLDEQQRRLTGSRDRLGIKPLYWALDGDRLLLSSEIRQIIAATGRASANTPLVLRYLRGNRIPCYDETFFEEIRSVPAGTWFEIALDGDDLVPRFRSYWTLSRIVAPSLNGSAAARYAEERDGFERLLRETVASHRRADVRVGALLSGGLDSSVLAAIGADDDPSALPTFSFGFRDRAPHLCELAYVDAIVTARPNLEHHEISLDSAWLASNASRVIATLEEPPLALPALAQYRVFELCRTHGVTVALDGEGSDEILAGYAPYQRALLIDLARASRPRRFTAELRAIAIRQQRSAAGVLYDFFGAPVLRRLHRPGGYAWLSPHGVQGSREPVDRSHDPSLVNRMLYDATRWGNVKIVLAYTDKNAMAHSVEARVPYMDHRVVERAFAMPAEFKVGNGDRKRILRDIGRRLLPPMVTERKDRMGFATPDELLMKGPFRETIRAAITDRSFAALEMFDPKKLQTFVDGWLEGTNRDFRAIWRLYALAAWRSEFGVRS